VTRPDRDHSRHPEWIQREADDYEERRRRERNKTAGLLALGILAVAAALRALLMVI